MAATEALMEGGQATFEKSGEKVMFELEPKNVGLTKEQLEAYRNDPFWKPVRTVLFIAFWLAWIAMFAAAIAIVVLSPKCAEKQQPDWWQTKVSYQLLTATFHDTNDDGVGDFKGIEKKLDLLKKIGVTTVYPTPIIKTDKDQFFNPYDVESHIDVDERFGGEGDFKNLIEAVHDRQMFIVMDMPVSSVSIKHTWFTSGDIDRFVTAKPGQPAYSLPNYHVFPDSNNTKYLGYPTAANPVLNWGNEEVKKHISDAMLKFLNLGVDGFHIDHVSQLAIDQNGKPDHDKAIAVLKELTGSIKKFISEIDELQDKKIVLFSSLRDIEELHAQAKETGDLHYVIDTSFARLSQKTCTSGVSACVHKTLTDAYKRHETDSYTPYWQFSSVKSSRLASRFDEDTANLMTFMQLTLPGALSLYYGQELGMQDVNGDQHAVMQWKPKGDDHHGFRLVPDSEQKMVLVFNETSGDSAENFEDQYALPNSPLKVYRNLAKLRQRDEALIVGETVRDVLDGDIVLFSRYVKNNGTSTGSVFVVALNFGEDEKSVNLFDHKDLLPTNKDLAKGEISAVTTGVSHMRARDKADLSATALTIPSKQGVLVKF